MAIKSDRWIKEMSINKEMINPFFNKQIDKTTISYGMSSGASYN